MSTPQSSSSSSSSSSVLVKDVLIKLLKYKAATYMVDEEGSTPLHTAAQRGSFLTLQLILSHCPQSTDIHDAHSRTMLHHLRTKPKTTPTSQSISYWELKDLFNIPEMDAIKDAKDSNGNTPAHVALLNRDFVYVKVLFECFADFTIKNKDGISALDIINSLPDFSTNMEEVMVTEKVFKETIDEELIQAAIKGDEAIFEGLEHVVDIESGEELRLNPNINYHFLRQTKQGFSILHLAVTNGHKKFIEKAIQHFPTLVFTINSSGETPLHVGARLNKGHYPVVSTLLQLSKDCVNKFRAEEPETRFSGVSPWRQKNSKGDTPIHVALHSSNYDLARDLMETDPELSSCENGVGETPLHVLARYGTYTKLDKIGALINDLTHQNESVVYKRDSHGLTPLLRAASCGRIRVAYWIIRHCPASVQFRDSKDRTFLHLLRFEPIAELDLMTTEDMLYMYTNILVLTSGVECDGSQGSVMMPVDKYKSLRKLTGVEFDVLRSAQDHEGNTPLHFALKHQKFGTAKFLLHWCLKSKVRQEMYIINNEGHSVFNLLELLPEDAPYVKELKQMASLGRKKVEDEIFGKLMMDSKVYKEAVEGNMDYFFKKKEENEDETSNDTNANNGYDNNDSKLWCQVAIDGSNILHLALQHGRDKFAIEVMKHHPELILERNSNGDTPLHTIAMLWKDVVGLHDVFVAKWEETCRKFNDNPSEFTEGLLVIPPWRVKNFQGNSPLHEALKLQRLHFAMNLVDFDHEVATYVNHVGETPVHLLSDSTMLFGSLELKAAMHLRDNEGLNPLLRAAKVGNIMAACRVLEECPETIQLRDHKGRSFLHLLRIREENSKALTLEFFEETTMETLRKSIDFDGNTPLHSAIQHGNSILAKALARRFVKSDDNVEGTQVRINNDDGKSVLDLLALHENAPNEVLQHLINKGALVNIHGLYIEGGWVRSGYGVCKSQIKDMANTLSVVAGLLATITFAAAFQVPGGYGGNGVPILLPKLAFQIFMISNMVALCGSMTVLFLLLWVMYTDSTTKSFMLLDMSITILQSSFAATLVAFMTGVYVVTFTKVLWLAIFVCAFCSTVTFFMRKHIVLHITLLFRIVLLGFVYCKVLPIFVIVHIFPRRWSIAILGHDFVNDML